MKSPEFVSHPCMRLHLSVRQNDDADTADFARAHLPPRHAWQRHVGSRASRRRCRENGVWESFLAPKWHLGPWTVCLETRNAPGFRGNLGVSAGVPGLEPRTNDRRRGDAAHLHMGQTSAEFRGSQGGGVYAMYGLNLVRFWGLWCVSGHETLSPAAHEKLRNRMCR